MDLHAWITQQVAKTERAAAAARDDIASLLAWHAAGSLIAERHINLNRPEAVLRRCEADRRILARHQIDPAHAEDRLYATACHGCGTFGDCDDPNVDNLNDCPELLDLAHAHGLTDETLGGLDRPEAPEPKRHPEGLGGMLRDAFADALTLPITTSDVPEALRGPRWKP
ncbi:DUF6221 family protein [Streptomyces sp. NPDC005483]|uniref:DUF6221 family protein n=1 Tax=Streptomyces sp. NPDC005483 TaxID=3154882 RepID=UPI0033BA13E4